jgi:hypothetical protein
MFSKTSRWGNIIGRWKTMFTGRWLGASRVMSSPSRRTRPADGLTNPAMTRRSVVFPQPDGPRKVMNWPGGISSSTSCKAATRP